MRCFGCRSSTAQRWRPCREPVGGGMGCRIEKFHNFDHLETYMWACLPWTTVSCMKGWLQTNATSGGCITAQTSSKRALSPPIPLY
jgi:hypothetical protein